jgi:hypothetical protein
MSTLILVSVLAALGFGIWHVLRTGLPRKETRLYQILLQQAGGDRERVDRLIDYELRRSPGLTRGQAIQTAIWRLDRDRR